MTPNGVDDTRWWHAQGKQQEAAHGLLSIAQAACSALSAVHASAISNRRPAINDTGSGVGLGVVVNEYALYCTAVGGRSCLCGQHRSAALAFLLLFFSSSFSFSCTRSPQTVQIINRPPCWWMDGWMDGWIDGRMDG